MPCSCPLNRQQLLVQGVQKLRKDGEMPDMRYTKSREARKQADANANAKRARCGADCQCRRIGGKCSKSCWCDGDATKCQLGIVTTLSATTYYNLSAETVALPPAHDGTLTTADVEPASTQLEADAMPQHEEASGVRQAEPWEPPAEPALVTPSVAVPHGGASVHAGQPAQNGVPTHDATPALGTPARNGAPSQDGTSARGGTFVQNGVSAQRGTLVQNGKAKQDSTSTPNGTSSSHGGTSHTSAEGQEADGTTGREAADASGQERKHCDPSITIGHMRERLATSCVICIASFNVNNLPRPISTRQTDSYPRTHNIASLIIEADADIVALQELCEGAADALADELSVQSGLEWKYLDCKGVNAERPTAERSGYVWRTGRIRQRQASKGSSEGAGDVILQVRAPTLEGVDCKQLIWSRFKSGKVGCNRGIDVLPRAWDKLRRSFVIFVHTLGGV
eukprot:jgi/Mesvir1/14905/Mv05503-RA.2